jgi:N-acyl amino acid synthase of PEP-CTERM/exosortase system
VFNDSSLEFMPFGGSQLIAPALSDNSLLNHFNTQFKTLHADTPERLQMAHAIRYQVYCVENPLESSSDNPSGFETDEFDAHSVHSLVVHRSSGAALATVRLILPQAHDSECCFAVQRLLDVDSLRLLHELPLRTTAEISRFSISREATHHLRSCAPRRERHETALERVSGPLARLGLIQGIVRMSLQHGITDWCALMEPALLRMLSAMAIRFQPIGPAIQFRGIRQPCWLNVSTMLTAVMYERPRFWELITDAGILGLSSAA